MSSKIGKEAFVIILFDVCTVKFKFLAFSLNNMDVYNLARKSVMKKCI